MFGIKKRKALIWSVTISLLLFQSCSTATGDEKRQGESYSIQGNTQGTTYQIIIVDGNQSITKFQLDSLFTNFDLSLSTYVDHSIISKLNSTDYNIEIIDENGFFKECYDAAYSVYLATDGAFDPSVFPLVKGWGFMNNMETPLTKDAVDSILKYVSFAKDSLYSIAFIDNVIQFQKNNDKFKIDFNAIAQGHSVDVVADFLEDKGIENYYIEIGGELFLKGHNKDNVPWIIGVDAPTENASERKIVEAIHLSNKAIATSGNYRKFYIVDGVKYSHSLNPKTGFPVKHSLLSATVIAENCIMADAYATAFMVMGTDKTLAFVESHPELNLEVYLMFNDGGELKTVMSDGFNVYLK